VNTFSLALFYGWAAALLLSGATGVLAGPWELRTIFQVDVATLDPAARSTLLNHYRFLRALELGVGAVCLAYRKPMLTIRAWNRVFLALLVTSAGARALSLAADGRPRWFLLVVTAFECLTAAVFATRASQLVERA
jgi:hypothetical protein